MAEETKPFSDDEIIVCLESFTNMSIPVEQLKLPSAAFLKSILECFMRDLQSNIEALKMMPLKSEDNLDFVEYLEDALVITPFFSSICILLEYAGITDLSIKDIFEPKPKRTRKILSFLITMWKYLLTKFQTFSVLEDEMKEEKEGKQQSYNHLLELEEEYELLCQQQIDPVQRDEVEGISSSKEKEFNKVQKEKDTFHTNYQNVKTEIADEKKNISNLDVQIILLNERLAELDKSILSSPEQLVSDIDDLKQKIEEKEGGFVEVKQKMKDVRQNLTNLNQKSESFSNTVSDAQACNENMEALRKETESIIEQDEQIEPKLKQVEDAEASIKSQEEQISAYEQKIVQLDLKYKSKLDGLRQMCSMLPGGIDNESVKLKSLMDVLNYHKQELRALKREIAKQEVVTLHVKEQKRKRLFEMKKAFDAFIQNADSEVDQATRELTCLLEQFIDN